MICFGRKLAGFGAALTGALTLFACSGEHVAGNGFEHAAFDQAISEETEVAAVMIHADWCASCRKLEPQLAAVRARAPFDDVAFLMLDYTDRNENAFFKQADDAGVGAFIRKRFAHEIATGQILLVDLDRNKFAGVLTQKMTEDEMVNALLLATQSAAD